MAKYYVIAGEASGDMHAANLVSALRKVQADTSFRGWGGDRMQNAGVEVVKHYKDLAFMGFVEVLFNLHTIFKNIKFCKADIECYQPDTLILVDYPGFNLRIAKWAHLKGIKVVYYISPQLWAWKKGRVHQIKRYVDQMLVILPFEKNFYQNYDYAVDYVGHPLLDALAQEEVDDAVAQREDLDNNKPIIALLPGSRRQEIRQMLPLMLSQVELFPNYVFVVAAAPAIEEGFYTDLMPLRKNVRVIAGQTHQLLRKAQAALVTSGTATLETALLRVPQVVCYKGNSISFAIAKYLVDINFISLVNLIMEREVVTELIQGDLKPKRLQSELQAVLQGEKRANMLVDYELLSQKLGGVGASCRAAQLIVKNHTAGF